VLRIIDFFLDSSAVSFLPNASIGELCDDLSTIVGQGIWHDTCQVQNTKWLYLVIDIVTTINSDSMCYIRALSELCGWNTKLSKRNQFLSVVR
jgi:hypothetical protein